MSYDYEIETVFVKHEYFYLWARGPLKSRPYWPCKNQQQSMRQLIGSSGAPHVAQNLNQPPTQHRSLPHRQPLH